MDDIREGRTRVTDLPPIQVVIGDLNEEGGVWYYTLNNRRLWVIKQLKKEGLVERIGTRARRFKGKEPRRYCIEKCVLEASLMRTRAVGSRGKKEGEEDQGGRKEIGEEERISAKNGKQDEGINAHKHASIEETKHLDRDIHMLNAETLLCPSSDSDEPSSPAAGFEALHFADSSDEVTEEEKMRKQEKAKRQAAKRRRQKEKRKKAKEAVNAAASSEE